MTNPARPFDGSVPSLSTTVIDAPDANALAAFYRELLQWEVVNDEPGWVMIRPSDGGTGLSFQSEPLHARPVWPSTTDHPQMQMHLDVYVPDMMAGVERAIALGATLAECQPHEHVRVMLDPAGHQFCLFDR